jgi:hypothetical protein
MPPANGAVTITKTNKKPILLTLKCSHLDEMPAANVKVSKSVGSVGSVESIKSIKSVLKNRSEYLKCRDIMI